MSSEEPLSEFFQGLINIAWGILFDPTKGLFLPDLLKQKLEPLLYPGPSAEFAIPIDLSQVDAACMAPQHTKVAIATGRPRLTLLRSRIRGFWALRPKGDKVDFSLTAPELTATLIAGRVRDAETPIVIDADGNLDNYRFAIGCCFARESQSRVCDGNSWTVDARGTFRAEVQRNNGVDKPADTMVAVTLRVGFAGGDMKITVPHIKLTVPQQNIALDFKVDDLDPDDRSIAEGAIQTGIAGDAVQQTLQGYFDSDTFRAELGQLITEQINEAVKRLQ